MVVQKVDEKNTLLVCTESEDIEKIYHSLWSIKVWLGHSVNIGGDVVTPKQVAVENQLCWVQWEEIVSVECTNMQLPRQMQEPQCDNSYWRLASQVVGRMPKFSTFSEDFTQKGGGLVWTIGIWSEECDAKYHRGNIEGEKVWSLCRVMANLAWYLGLPAPVPEIIKKIELVYGTLASFYILLQTFYNLQQGKMEKVTV